MKTKILALLAISSLATLGGKSLLSAETNEKHDDHAHKESTSKEEGHGEEHGDDHNHAHDENEAHDETKDHDDHKDHSAHKDHDENEKHDEHAHGEDEHAHGEHGEGEHEEENSAIGPEKGILAKGPKGFQLSPEAHKIFGIQTIKFTGASIPKETIVSVLNEKFVYAVSNGWIKKVHLDDVSPGMELASTATGFIRIAELVAEEGMAEGHAH